MTVVRANTVANASAANDDAESVTLRAKRAVQWCSARGITLRRNEQGQLQLSGDGVLNAPPEAFERILSLSAEILALLPDHSLEIMQRAQEKNQKAEAEFSTDRHCEKCGLLAQAKWRIGRHAAWLCYECKGNSDVS